MNWNLRFFWFRSQRYLDDSYMPITRSGREWNRKWLAKQRPFSTEKWRREEEELRADCVKLGEWIKRVLFAPVERVTPTELPRRPICNPAVPVGPLPTMDEQDREMHLI